MGELVLRELLLTAVSGSIIHIISARHHCGGARTIPPPRRRGEGDDEEVKEDDEEDEDDEEEECDRPRAESALPTMSSRPGYKVLDDKLV